MRDMFGIEITVAEARAILGRKTPQRKGYAAPPGSGPEGETCKTCKNLVRHCGGAKTYLKCGLMRAIWTGGYGTDILSKAPACRLWVQPADAVTKRRA
jgi:hypothetical protein